ncbi:MAG: ABC transporter permease [Firmicutes bacterium]|nr:ABC transporter permease [Bacillota bacterium]
MPQKEALQNAAESLQIGGLTRKQLQKLESKEKTKKDKRFEAVTLSLPILCGLIAVAEYLYIPDNRPNHDPHMYLYVLFGFIAAYVIYLVVALIRQAGGESAVYEKVHYKAPRYAALFLLAALYDYLTLKTGILTQPFVPCMNFIICAAVGDRMMLWDCTIHTLLLLFLGYSIGVLLGLITGIACGYSKRCRYWVDPVINFLGPIPTSTWIPIMMVVASSLFGGAVFIIALGSWFAVTVASMTGVHNVDKDLFDAARTLGAKERQLVFRVAIPHAMPSILQGCTQAMGSSCTAIMIAEMLGVKSGLGWYMTWAKAWASYDKMFAALFVICLIFTLVTKSLDLVKRHVLRWQTGVESNG